MSNAPIIAWSAESGHRLATTSEVASVLKDEALYPETRGGWSILPGGTMARCLSCSDPLDMRAVWYYAALHFGASKERALRAFLEREAGLIINGCVPWNFRPWESTHYLTNEGNDTIEAATEALCAAIWGPK